MSRLPLPWKMAVRGLSWEDDLAGQNGLLVDPLYLRKHYFPEPGVWLEKLQAGSVPILFHSDGNILEIIRSAPAGLLGLTWPAA